MKKNKTRRGIQYLLNLLVMCFSDRKKQQLGELLTDLSRAKAALKQRAASETFAINGKGDKEFGSSCNRVARMISKII